MCFELLSDLFAVYITFNLSIWHGLDAYFSAKDATLNIFGLFIHQDIFR